MFKRQRNTASAGTTPRPRERRQTARRWSGPRLLETRTGGYNLQLDRGKEGTCIQKRTSGTNAAMTKPKSIIVSGKEEYGSMSVVCGPRLGRADLSRVQASDAKLSC